MVNEKDFAIPSIAEQIQLVKSLGSVLTDRDKWRIEDVDKAYKAGSYIGSANNTKLQTLWTKYKNEGYL